MEQFIINIKCAARYTLSHSLSLSLSLSFLLTKKSVFRYFWIGMLEHQNIKTFTLVLSTKVYRSSTVVPNVNKFDMALMPNLLILNYLSQLKFAQT